MVKMIILASGSPRRQMFLKEMGFPFQIEKQEIDESYPEHLKGAEIAIFLAHKKAIPFQKTITPQQMVITADTIVWHQDQCLGKPQNTAHARSMLNQLSGTTHEVITAVGFLTTTGYETLHEISSVTFKSLLPSEIEAYIATQAPFDKAGSYGIQDHFGKMAVKKIKGSYSNIVGLPIEPTKKKIDEILNSK